MHLEKVLVEILEVERIQPGQKPFVEVLWMAKVEEVSALRS